MMKAAFKSVEKTIESTGDVIGDLFGEYASVDDTFKETHIEAAIREEQRRRDEALQIQKELAGAQVAYLNAQTRAIQRGESAITVQADGLKPHLEAILWELLESIQVKVTSDLSNFLVGVA